jgi:hypothetical protein
MSDPIRDSLDDAIDRVASRLVSVKDDPDVARRIVAGLPPQPERGWWSVSLPLQVAAMAAVVLVIVYVRTSNPGERASVENRDPTVVAREQPAHSPESRQEVEQPHVAAATGSATRRVVRRPVDTQPVFGLAAIEAPEQLSLSTLVATVPLEPVAPAAVSPLSISDLPLTGDPQPPLSKE